MVPTPDGSDDLTWVSLPDEGSWILVVLLDEAIDGRLQIDDRMEHAVFQASPRELGEEALDGIQLRAGRWNEVEGPSWMPCQPGADLGLLVGRIIVEDDVDGLVGGQFGFDGVEESDELLMPVTLHIAADH